MTEQTQTRMTAAEFRQLPESDGFVELINGELIVSPSPIDIHQDLVLNVAVLLRAEKPHGKVVVAPMDVYLDNVNVFQPDVFWMADNSQCVNRDGYYYGAPELIVEVLSPGSSTRDKRDKFDAYEQHGVLEYWLVDPAGQHIEVWQRQGARFVRRGIYQEGDSVPSNAFGKVITIRDVFAY